MRNYYPEVFIFCFDNDYLEMSMVHLMDQRSCCIKLGYCDEILRTIWRKCKKEILV